MRLCFRFVLTAFLVISVSKAEAFCVSTAPELQSALTTAASDGEDDIVRVVQGLYEGNFIYASTEPFDLSVEGGYTDGCAGRDIDPTNTVLDGLDTERVLVLSTDQVVDFGVEGLTLQNGRVLSAEGGGLFVLTPGDVSLLQNRVTSNSGGDGGGIYISGTNTVTLDQNIISVNGGRDGGGVFVEAETITLSDNSITENGGSAGGGVFLNAATATLSDNTISDNTGSS